MRVFFQNFKDDIVLPFDLTTVCQEVCSHFVLWMYCVYSLAAFSIFSLSLVFRNLIMICHGMWFMDGFYFFGVFVLLFFEHLESFKNVLTNMESFGHYFIKHFCWLPLCWNSNYAHIGVFHIIPQKSLRLCCLPSLSLFSLCSILQFLSLY